MSKNNPKKRNVVCGERFLLSPSDLSSQQKAKLKNLNDKLSDLEVDIKKEALSLIEWTEPRIADPNDWVKCFEIECSISFCLREDDSEYCEDNDNVLVELWERGKTANRWEHGVGDGENHNEFAHSDHPMKDEYHCWLYHCLYDHTDLGWVNLLRIGDIWVDVSVTYQNFVSL